MRVHFVHLTPTILRLALGEARKGKEVTVQKHKTQTKTFQLFYPKFVFVKSSDALIFCVSLPGARVGQDVLFYLQSYLIRRCVPLKKTINHLFFENLFDTRSCVPKSNSGHVCS